MGTPFLGLSLPTSFGKFESSSNLQGFSASALTRLKNATRTQYLTWKSDKLKTNESNSLKTGYDSDSSDNSDDRESEFDLDDIPVSHELVLKEEHTKSISSISIDPSGSRMLSASHDSTFKLWDFNNMDIVRHSPFRTVVPLESYQLHGAYFSHNGSNILVIPRHTNPKIYNRDGNQVAEFPSGDKYIVDMKNTKGHTAEMSDGVWGPNLDGSVFATSGNDSTIRIWNVENTKSQTHIIILRSKGNRGDKINVTSISWIRESDNYNTTSMLLGGSNSGSLALWDTRISFVRPSQFIENAHKLNSSVTTISPRPSSYQIATRGTDEFLKLWDIRQLKFPILSKSGMNISSEERNSLTFDSRPSSLGKYLLVGNSSGGVNVLDTSDLENLIELDLSSLNPSYSESQSLTPNVTSLFWHPKLNQIVAGLTNGQLSILFSPESSTRGGLSMIKNEPKRRNIDDTDSAVDITANGLEEGISREREARITYQLSKRLKRQHEKERNNLLKSRQNVSEPSMKNNDIEDPRNELLKYAEKAEKIPILIKSIQPSVESTIKSQSLTTENEQDEEARIKKKKKPHNKISLY